MQRRLSTPNCNVDAVLATPPTALLREWAKAKLTNGTWKDALDLAVNVSISLQYCALCRFDIPSCLQFTPPKVAIYQAIVERLKATDRIVDAVECFHQMASELRENIELGWVLGKWFCIFSAALLMQRFCQTLSSVLPSNWRIWEILLLPSDMTRPSLSTRLHYLSSLLHHKTFLRSEARRT